MHCKEHHSHEKLCRRIPGIGNGYAIAKKVSFTKNFVYTPRRNKIVETHPMVLQVCS